jgi:glycosidase
MGFKTFRMLRIQALCFPTSLSFKNQINHREGLDPVRERIYSHLIFLYGQEIGARYFEKLRRILDRFLRQNPGLRGDDVAPGERLTEADAILITYGDQITAPGRPPLQTLAEFLDARLKGVLSGVHILPFFPYSSDDGFSVIDYAAVDPRLGTWEDVQPLRADFRLMFDAVVNHISAQSAWFQAFLQDDPTYSDYFIVVEPGTDLSMVTRPRALPLLTPVQTPSGEKLVWTTFSTDQVDLNFANPEVLLAIVEVLLLYVEKGADLIRLDAIAYLWKTIGTSCIHLEQTHRVVQLMRAVLDAVAPHVLLITETNVPHEENVSYFGDGANEAQMVYQFSLAPLILDAFHSGDARHLLRWAEGLRTPAPTTTFFNFTASHDGIGVRPVEGILDAAAFQRLVDTAQAHGGYVSFKTDPDGAQSPYELNISYFDALSDPAAVGREGLEVQIRRFMASQAIMLSLAGVPGVYVHSLLGSRSHRAGVRETGRYRSINREKLRRAELEAALADPVSLRRQVFERYLHLLRTRTTQGAFHPNGPQQVLALNDALFALLRTSPDGQERLLCLHNVSDQDQSFQVNLGALDVPHRGALGDLLTGARYPVDGEGRLALAVAPYQVLWLKT